MGDRPNFLACLPCLQFTRALTDRAAN